MLMDLEDTSLSPPSAVAVPPVTHVQGAVYFREEPPNGSRDHLGQLPHFKADGTKFQRGEVTCPKSPAGYITDCMELRVLIPRPSLLYPTGSVGVV